MDMFCNKALVDKTFKSGDIMRLKSNGGSIVVNEKATIYLGTRKKFGSAQKGSQLLLH